MCSEVAPSVLGDEPFQYQVAVADARLPELPSAGVSVPAVQQVPPVERLEVAEAPRLSYVRECLDETEEKHIIAQIEQAAFTHPNGDERWSRPR